MLENIVMSEKFVPKVTVKWKLDEYGDLHRVEEPYEVQVEDKQPRAPRELIDIALQDLGIPDYVPDEFKKEL